MHAPNITKPASLSVMVIDMRPVASEISIVQPRRSPGGLPFLPTQLDYSIV